MRQQSNCYTAALLRRPMNCFAFSPLSSVSLPRLYCPLSCTRAGGTHLSSSSWVMNLKSSYATLCVCSSSSSVRFSMKEHQRGAGPSDGTKKHAMRFVSRAMIWARRAGHGVRQRVRGRRVWSQGQAAGGEGQYQIPQSGGVP